MAQPVELLPPILELPVPVRASSLVVFAFCTVELFTCRSRVFIVACRACHSATFDLYLAGAQVPGPFSIAFLDALTGSWIRSEHLGFDLVLSWDAVLIDTGLTCC